MKILLTGASTPLGRRVYRDLSPRHEVVILARPAELEAYSGPRPEGQVVVADTVTPERYAEAMRGTQALIHLDETSQADDPELIEVNLKGTQSLLHAFSAWGAPELLLLLSSALIQHPYPDDLDASPDRYGSMWLATRIAAEARANHWARRTGWETLIVRSGHPYGAVGVDGPLSGWLDAAAESAEGDGHLEIEGADIPMPFVRIDPLAQAFVERIDGQPMPGERRLVGSLSRVEAVGMVASLGQIHDRLCGLTERAPSRGPVRVPVRRRLLAYLSPAVSLPSTPAFLRGGGDRAPNPEWVEVHGRARPSEVAEALVGGAC